MDSFFIIANALRDPEGETAGRIEKYLKDRGKKVSCHITDRADGTHYTDASMIDPDTEAVIVLGGDGTMIAAARDTSDLGLPLLGINKGTLGYLADVEVESIEAAMDALIDGSYIIEDRMMLCGEAWDSEGGMIADSRALNDVVIRIPGEMKAARFTLSVNGNYLSGFRADGVIVATPTGSTAYSMSAGGPIIEPTAQMMAVTPICPHTLNMRSIVLSGDKEIMMRSEGRGSMVFFDGSGGIDLGDGGFVTVRKSRRCTRFIRIRQESFLAVLRNKLGE